MTTTLNIYAGLFPNRLDEVVAALDGIYREAKTGPRAVAHVDRMWTKPGDDSLQVGGNSL